VPKGLLIKDFLKILLNDGVFEMDVLELTICEVNGRSWPGCVAYFSRENRKLLKLACRTLFFVKVHD